MTAPRRSWSERLELVCACLLIFAALLLMLFG